MERLGAEMVGAGRCAVPAGAAAAAIQQWWRAGSDRGRKRNGDPGSGVGGSWLWRGFGEGGSGSRLQPWLLAQRTIGWAAAAGGPVAAIAEARRGAVLAEVTAAAISTIVVAQGAIGGAAAVGFKVAVMMEANRGETWAEVASVQVSMMVTRGKRSGEQEG